MQLSTMRFGTIRITTDDIFFFPDGLVGLEDRHDWILLADAGNDAVGWLQNTTDAGLALAVVSPRRFAPHYRVRITRRELAAIDLGQSDRAFVLNIAASNEGRLTINLRAPLIFNLDRRLGRQVITADDQPIQWELTASPFKLRKSA